MRATAIAAAVAPAGGGVHAGPQPHAASGISGRSADLGDVLPSPSRAIASGAEGVGSWAQGVAREWQQQHQQSERRG